MRVRLSTLMASSACRRAPRSCSTPYAPCCAIPRTPTRRSSCAFPPIRLPPCTSFGLRPHDVRLLRGCGGHRQDPQSRRPRPGACRRWRAGRGAQALALTFMNGARRRLDARLGENPVFRRRFDCQTFDVFARTLATRRRSLITPEMEAQAAALNEFDGPCALSATLLQYQAVQQWIARTFPLVLVDEAQDLDEYRAAILRGLSSSCGLLRRPTPSSAFMLGGTPRP